MSIDRALMVFVEPTPYIRGFVDACSKEFKGAIQVFYLRTDASQSWALSLNPAVETVLPTSRFAAFRAIARALSVRPRSSLLHLAGWGEPLLAGAMLLARARSIPVFVESDTWQKQESSGFVGMIKRAVLRLLLRLPTHFLPAGSRQAALLSSYGVAKHRITLAHMTVDVAAMQAFAATGGIRAKQRQVLNLASGETAFLFVGRLEAQKGVITLIEAFDLLCKRGVRAHLIIVGDGSARFDIERAAQASTLVNYLGRLSGAELWATFVACDVLVLPSSFEPWGLVVNEAMAFGLPVIVTDVVGCVDDLVTDSCEGLIVSGGDASALAEAMGRFLDNDFRGICAESARRRITNWTLADEARNVVGAWSKEAVKF